MRRILLLVLALMSLNASVISQANNGVGDTLLRIPSPGVEVQPDMLRLVVAVDGGSSTPIDPPDGWGLLSRINQGTNVALACFGRTAHDPEPLVDFIVTFGGQTVEASGGLWLINSDQAVPITVRTGFFATATRAVGTSHAAPAANVTQETIDVYSPALLCIWAMKDTGGANVWTPPGSMAEEFQQISGGPSGISIMGAREGLVFAGNTGTRTATSSASKASAVMTLYVMERGMEQPTGTALATITSLRDSAMAYAGPAAGFNEIEVAASFPATFRDRGVVGASRYIEAYGGLKLGGESGTESTTFRQSGRFILGFVSGSLFMAGRDYTSWHLELGTKFVNDEGDEGGKDGPELHMGIMPAPLAGNVKLYGMKIGVGSTAVQYLPSASVNDSEIIDCDFESQGGTLILGNSSFRVKKVKGCQFRNNATFCANVLADICEENTWIGNPSGGFMSALVDAAFRNRFCRFVGTPGNADVTISGANGNSEFVGQRWSNNKAKFNKVSGTSTITKANAHREYQVLEAVLVSPTGAPVATVPIRYVDAEAVTQFNVTSDAGGRLIFGSADHKQNAIKSVDNYMTAGVMVRDGLFPGTLIVNEGAGANPAYAAQEIPINWPFVDYGFGPQYEPRMFLVIELNPPAGIPPPLPTDDVPYFQEPDIAAVLEIEGQDVSVGGQTTKGILRRFTEEQLTGLFNVPILGTGVVVQIKTDSLSALAIGVLLGTDGRTYKVRDIRQIGDGALTDVLLAETT